MFVTFDVSHLLKSKFSNNLQYQNIYLISVTFDVSNLSKPLISLRLPVKDLSSKQSARQVPSSKVISPSIFILVILS